jgi:hypothetical protein
MPLTLTPVTPGTLYPGLGQDGGVLTTSGSPTFNSDSTCTINSTGSDRVRAPADRISKTQMWLAVRFKTTFASSDLTMRRWFTFADDTNNEVFGQWGGGSAIFSCGRDAGGPGTNAEQAASFASGDILTAIFALTSTQVKVSVNGAAFSVASNSGDPTITATLFDIGQRGYAAQDWINSDVYWVACGTGTLTDADAATIHAWGNSDPDPGQLPGTPTMVWPANSATYWIPATSLTLTAVTPGSLTLTPA